MGRQQHAVMWGGYVLIRSVLTLMCEGPGGLSAARKKRPRFTCIVMYPNCKFICVERRSRTEATRRSERTSDPLRLRAARCCTRGMIAGGAIIRLYTGHTAWLVSSRRDMRSKQSSKLDRMKRSWSVRLPLSRAVRYTRRETRVARRSTSLLEWMCLRAPNKLDHIPLDDDIVNRSVVRQVTF